MHLAFDNKNIENWTNNIRRTIPETFCFWKTTEIYNKCLLGNFSTRKYIANTELNASREMSIQRRHNTPGNRAVKINQMARVIRYRGDGNSKRYCGGGEGNSHKWRGNSDKWRG